ncbi:hypothetical protein [Nitrosopumilus sp.]|uniref:hypothetical protein n=1 Tax=Nitrosopumilus sp. TaxID=2024843 RepID=UPI003B5A5850
MTEVRAIEFEIIKEPWNKYQIQDNSVLKTRTILKKVNRVTDGDKIGFNIDAQTLTVIHADPSLKGEPNPKPVTNEEIQKSIEKSDMRYDTLAQEFNEYELDDGTKIKIYTNVTSISKSNLKDRSGDPIYFVQSSNQVEIKPASHYNPQK